MRIRDEKSKELVRMELLELHRILQQEDQELTDGHVGGYLQLIPDLDLHTITEKLQGGEIEYNPVDYPAVFYDIASAPLTVVLFGDGRLCVVDGASEDTVRDSILETVERLKDIRVYSSNQPVKDEIVVITILM